MHVTLRKIQWGMLVCSQCGGPESRLESLGRSREVEEACLLPWGRSKLCMVSSAWQKQSKPKILIKEMKWRLITGRDSLAVSISAYGERSFSMTAA